MLYEKLNKLSAANFKRYCGVERKTFDKICAIVRRKSAARRLVAGRPPQLEVEDQVLLTIEYWREYRTMFHLSQSWGVSEASVSRTIARVEDILTDSKAFALPGKRRANLSPAIEVVVVDALETPIERPKKNRSATIRARKSGTR